MLPTLLAYTLALEMHEHLLRENAELRRIRERAGRRLT